MKTARARVTLSHRSYGLIRSHGCALKMTIQRAFYVRVSCLARASIPSPITTGTPTTAPTPTSGGNIASATGFIGGKCLVDGFDTGVMVNGTGYCSATGLTYIEGQPANTFLNGVLYQNGLKYSGVYQGGLYDQGIKISVNGALDKETFQQKGYVESEAGIRPLAIGVWPKDTALRSDGAIVTMGLSMDDPDGENPPVQQTVVTRHLLDGSPDPSFGENGVVMFPQEQSAISVFLSGEKTILVMWGKIIRLNENGSFDTSFASGGTLDTKIIGSPYWRFRRQALQLPDGKLLVYAFSDYYSASLGRFNSDGSIDTSFGNNGILTVNRLLTHLSVSAMNDGRLLLSFIDYKPTSQNPDSAGLMMLKSDGSLDTSFGFGGSREIPFGYQRTAPLSNGKILGFQWDKQRIIRYLPDGSIDTSYGTGGIAQVPDQKLNPSDWGWQRSLEKAFTTLSDGRAVIGGAVFSQPNVSTIKSLPLVAAFTENGALDSSFGVNGVQQFNFFDKDSGEVMALKTAPDGRVVGVSMSPTTTIPIPIMVLFRVWY